MGTTMVAKDEEFAVMLAVQRCGVSAFKRTVQFDNGSSHSTSKTAEFDESISLDGEHTAGKVASTPLWSRSQAKFAHDFARWAETSGVSVITTRPDSVRHGGASSDALWKTRSLMEIQKRSRWLSDSGLSSLVFHVFGPSSLTLWKRSEARNLTLSRSKRAMLLLYGGNTQTGHEDRDLENVVNACIVTTPRNRNLENGMQRDCMSNIPLNCLECVPGPTVIICATRAQ